MMDDLVIRLQGPRPSPLLYWRRLAASKPLLRRPWPALGCRSVSLTRARSETSPARDGPLGQDRHARRGGDCPFRRARVADGTGGTLADVLERARRDLGMTLGDLTVLSAAHDPYRCATPSSMRDAQWAANHFAAIGASHLRNFHYRLLGKAKKPNDETYSGSNKDWRWLKRAVAAARWRRLIPFDALEDRRADGPKIHRAERNRVRDSGSCRFGFRRRAADGQYH